MIAFLMKGFPREPYSVSYSTACHGPLCVCFTVWCTHTSGAALGKEADRTSDQLDPQVRGNPFIKSLSQFVKAV